MTMTRPRWGVPDWCDESAYPGPDTPMYEWRWQFLRRRPDYREFWSEFLDEDIENAHRFALRIREECPDYPMPPEDKYGWCMRVGFLDFALSTLDPSYPHYMPTSNVYPMPGGRRLTFPAPSFESHKEHERVGLVALRFDLNKPLAEQLKLAEQQLTDLQIEYSGELVTLGRQHQEKWPIYLRVIDARDDGQSWGTIASEILRYTRNTSQAGRQVWEQAQRVMFKVGA